MIALRLALRDLRGGLGGLRLLAVCLFLGVAAIAGVGSLSSSIVAALASQGQEILGGDVEVRIAQRRATDEERAAFTAEGDLTEIVQMRANVATEERSIIGELKAVDDAFPLYGDFSLQDGLSLPEALAGGVVIGRDAAETLGLVIGDRVRIGFAELPVSGVLSDEPDKVAEGFVLGPTLLMNAARLAETQLERPGSLYRVHYRIRTSGDVDPGEVASRLEETFPEAGFRIQDRTNAAPGARRFILNTGQFLTMVGLTSLLVAGVGVASGVGSYLSAKTRAIAALKSIGADSSTIFAIYLIQIAIVALIAVVAGAAIGALVPALVGALAGDTLPVPPRAGIYPLPLFSAILYGLLAAALFALWPLTQARDVPAARLFRAGVEKLQRPPLGVVLAMAAAAVIIAALAILQAREPLFAAGFLGAAVAVLFILAALAGLITFIARRLPRPRQPLVRLALANLTRPGGMTRELTIALGLGLTLFATLAVIETNLGRQIGESIPAEAPSHFVLDIPSDSASDFRATVENAAEGAGIRMVPSLRGPVTMLNDVKVADMDDIPEGGWVLRGDRGLTYAWDVPEGNRVIEGEWWPDDYDGPQLVSMDAEIAATLGLSVGDRITVTILGLPLEATISNLREIDWGSMGFNFALVYSPGPIEQAPHSFMATVRAANGDDRALSRAMGARFPSASMIRVRDVVSSAQGLLSQLTTAIRASASVAILAGIAVLVGAIAAARRARTYDAVMLKVLGATRGQILIAFLIEFVLLAVTVSGLALALGAAGGWYVVTQVFDLEWLPDWAPVLAITGSGAAVVILFSLVGAWQSLRVRPAQALRSL
ncbi:FtsX-like permease family protein [Pacificimonas sp. WHA3]|uniref:FtsX-like permease family protein n=1 Tax=Pacificimonas pallii TaxID=2827236 RepID=A0ABS6SD42_9SPHN|nr:FtsX-like permease family protein [Pacificimonas pallii]MBV7256340.1 FtsX-like permease family protein [Pacificimonas pallii]